MHIAIVSRNKSKLEKHRSTLKKYLHFMSSSPDFIIAIGGDGTFLAAERMYSGVPTLLVRDGSICKKCTCDDLEFGLQSLMNKKYHIAEFPKLEVSCNNKKLEGVNDIVIRNMYPTHALRFNIVIDGKRIENIIGDGIVVSTAFGSESYFYSITGKHFETGIGIAFNNTTENLEPLFLPQSAEITLELTRGTAHVAADNNPHILSAKQGGIITIKQSPNVARIVRLK